MRIFLRIVAFLTVLILGSKVHAQTGAAAWGTRYPAIEERAIVETKWRYIYAIHLKSNNIIHQAENF